MEVQQQQQQRQAEPLGRRSARIYSSIHNKQKALIGFASATFCPLDIED